MCLTDFWAVFLISHLHGNEDVQIQQSCSDSVAGGIKESLEVLQHEEELMLEPSTQQRMDICSPKPNQIHKPAKIPQ